MSDLGDRLRDLGACEEVCEWANNYKTSRDAWAACERGNEMLWLLGRMAGPPESESRRRLVLTTCACARLALPYAPEGEDRPRVAIETAERWARQEEGVTLRDVQITANAADSAAAYAPTTAATVAAYAAAYAAYSAYTTLSSVATAYAACDAAARAATAAAYSAAHSAATIAAGGAHADHLRKCADIVRAHYADPPELPEPRAKESNNV